MQNASKHIFKTIINLACRTRQRTHLHPRLIGLGVEQGTRQPHYRASDDMSPIFCCSACLPLLLVIHRHLLPLPPLVVLHRRLHIHQSPLRCGQQEMISSC